MGEKWKRKKKSGRIFHNNKLNSLQTRDTQKRAPLTRSAEFNFGPIFSHIQVASRWAERVQDLSSQFSLSLFCSFYSLLLLFYSLGEEEKIFLLSLACYPLARLLETTLHFLISTRQQRRRASPNCCRVLFVVSSSFLAPLENDKKLAELRLSLAPFQIVLSLSLALSLGARYRLSVGRSKWNRKRKV